MQKIGQFFLLLSLGLFPKLLWAQVAVVNDGVGHDNNAPSLGQVAGGLTVSTGFFSDVLHNMFYVIGVALLAASIIKYRDHKQNPSETPLRKPLILFFAGLIIGFFPLMVNYIGQHIG